MEAKPFINPYLAGVLLGCVLFGAFALTHSGLEASGAVSRVQVGLTSIVAQGHVDRVGSFAAIGGGNRKSFDHPSVYMLLGTFAGAFIAAWRSKRLKLEVCRGPRVSPGVRLFLAALGGGLAGYGARFARGDTSEALSGSAVLSAGSWATMLAVFASAYLVAWFVRRLWT